MSVPPYSQYPPQPDPAAGYPPQGAYPPGYMAPAPIGPKPEPHWGWMVVAIIFFWPLAIPSGINASKVDSYWLMGQPQAAAKASADAMKFGQIALWIGVGLIVVGIVFYGIILGALLSLS